MSNSSLIQLLLEGKEVSGYGSSGNHTNLLALHSVPRKPSIEEIIRESVLEDLSDSNCQNVTDITVTEITKHAKKPFKRKPAETCEIIEIDSDDDNQGPALNSSLEAKKSKIVSQTYNHSPISSNCSENSQSGVLVPMKSQICLLFVFSSSGGAANTYFGLALSGGTLFFPSRMENERKEIMNDTKNMYTLNMKKVDPKRNSFDTVEVKISENQSITIEKPGSGILVLQKVQNKEPFYVAQGGLNRISELHKAIRNGRDWIIDLKVLKMCTNINSSVMKEEEMMDLRFLRVLSKKFKSQGIQKIMHEFQHLKDKTKKYPFQDDNGCFELLTCSFCNTKFDFAVEHMYHLYKDKKCSGMIKEYCEERIIEVGCSPTADQNSIASAIICDKLTRNIKFSSTETNLKCDKCSLISASKIYYLVHLDRHLRKGRVFPCYKCRKIFLAPFWFIQHQCSMEFTIETSSLSISPEMTAVCLYEKVDKKVRDMILTCPNLNCSKKYNFMSGIFSHLQLRTPCLLGLVKSKKVEFEWNCSIDFEKLVLKVYKIEATVIQCDICNEICLSEIAYLMHIDHHRLHITLECLQCQTEFVTVCSFYSHTCQTKTAPFCIICDAFKKREANPYVNRKSIIANEQAGKDRNVGELAKSIETLMDAIMNYKEEDDNEDPSTEVNTKDSNVDNQFQNRFIDYLNSANEENGIGHSGENIIDLSEDDSGSLNNSGAEEVFDSVEDLLAESDGDEYIEPDFEIKSEEILTGENSKSTT